MKALVLNQPYATLVALGVKTWETRPAPPNGPMRPDGVRGLPGLAVEPGERIAIVAGAKPLAKKLVLGGYEAWPADRPGQIHPNHEVERPARLYSNHGSFLGLACWHPLPLGVVVCTVEVAEVLPIGYDHPPSVLIPPGIDFCGDGRGLLLRTGEYGRTPEVITGQGPYGDWRSGRWAWRLANVERTDPIPVTGRQGVFALPDDVAALLDVDKLLAVIPATEERPGFDKVYLPTTYVDRVAAQPDGWTQTLADACREAVARRPRVERVDWWMSVGHRLAMPMLGIDNATIQTAAIHEDGRVSVSGCEDPDNPDEDDRGEWTANFWFGQHGFDGKIEVLPVVGEE